MEGFSAVISTPSNVQFGRKGVVVEVIGHVFTGENGTELPISSYATLNEAYGLHLEVRRTPDSRGTIVVRRFVACSWRKVRREARELSRAFSRHLNVPAVVQ